MSSRQTKKYNALINPGNLNASKKPPSYLYSSFSTSGSQTSESSILQNSLSLSKKDSFKKANKQTHSSLGLEVKGNSKRGSTNS